VEELFFKGNLGTPYGNVAKKGLFRNRRNFVSHGGKKGFRKEGWKFHHDKLRGNHNLHLKKRVGEDFTEEALSRGFFHGMLLKGAFTI